MYRGFLIIAFLALVLNQQGLSQGPSGVVINEIFTGDPD